MIAELFELFKVQEFIREVFINYQFCRYLPFFLRYCSSKSVRSGLGYKVSESEAKKTIFNDFLNNEEAVA
jgi:hypothetical protein